MIIFSKPEEDGTCFLYCVFLVNEEKGEGHCELNDQPLHGQRSDGTNANYLFSLSYHFLDLVQALDRSIEMIQRKEVQPAKFNDELKEMYSWVNVAERTEKVYDAISQTRDPPLIERLRR